MWMPSFTTRQFGRIDYEEAAVIEFPLGLPAFEAERRFLAVERPATSPIVFFQSLSNPDLCFTALPVRIVEPAYEPMACPEDLEAVGIREGHMLAEGGIGVFALLTCPPGGPATANLLAPVLVNPEARKAVQAVRTDRRYSHQQPIGGAPCS